MMNMQSAMMTNMVVCKDPDEDEDDDKDDDDGNDNDDQHRSKLGS